VIARCIAWIVLAGVTSRVQGRKAHEGLQYSSANWSVSAARYQDNEITVTDDPLEVNAFERKFAAMWCRNDNEIMQ